VKSKSCSGGCAFTTSSIGRAEGLYRQIQRALKEDHDRLRIPPGVSHKRGGKKEPSLPAVRSSSSNSSSNHDLGDAHSAEDKSAKNNAVNKSTKVVLGPVVKSRLL